MKYTQRTSGRNIVLNLPMLIPDETRPVYDFKHRVPTTPEQGTTTYLYWEDDTLKSITDARGAKANYTGPLTVVVATLLMVSSPPLKVIARAGVKHVYSEETQAQARQLWEQAIAAKGGRERLRQITSLYVAADQGQGYRQSIFYVFPGFTFDYSYAPNRESTVILTRNAK